MPHVVRVYVTIALYFMKRTFHLVLLTDFMVFLLCMLTRIMQIVYAKGLPTTGEKQETVIIL